MRLGAFGFTPPPGMSPDEALRWSIGEAAQLDVEVMGAEGRAMFLWGTYPVDRGYWREMRARAAALGLEIEPYVRSPFDLVGPDAPSARKALVDSIRATLDLGGPVLRTGYGDQTVARTRFARIPLAEHLKLMEANLREAAPIAEAEGVVLAIENHTDFAGREWANVLAHVESDSIRCAFDTGNGMTVFCDPQEDAEALAPLTVTTHVKDMRVIDNPRPATGPSPLVPFGLVGCAIGEGNVGVLEIVKRLQRESPRGEQLPLIVEPSWPVVADGEDIATRRHEMLRASLRNLRHMLAAV